MKKINRKSILYSIPMFIVFIAVASVYYGHYGNTIEIIKSGYDAKIKLIEQSIYNETKYTEIISRMAETDMYDKMEANSNIIIEKYKDNPNVMAWDLKEMRNQLDNMDIYIIDKRLKVISSSIDKEVGLDLSLLPDFAKRLRERIRRY